MSAAVHLEERPAGPATDAGLYDHLGPGDRLIHRTRDAAFLALLRRHGHADLGRSRMLEIGCGEGALLRTLLALGARPANISAVDIERRRLGRARSAAASSGLLQADGCALPYADAAFDLALAFTSLSSVLDGGDRRRLASEALRVLRPGGLLVIYDFRLNPFNPRVRSVSSAEIERLFAPLPVVIEPVTLAPPLARALGGWPALCRALERISVLRTHLLAAVVKEAGPDR